MARVIQRRGGHAEGVHPFSAVSVREGRVVGRLGPPVRTTWRSAAKPFQLRTSLGVIGDPSLPPEELAVGAASHTAEPRHLAVVRAVLGRFGVAEEQLRCAAHAPLYRPAADAVVRAGGAFSDIHNNCSGKHAFMLAATRAGGWGSDYRARTHPLQARIRAGLVTLCGAEPDHGIDGCGVPTFVLPLAAFGRAWETLSVAWSGDGDPVLGDIARAMQTHPELVSGAGRLDLDIARGAQEPLIVKIGAQALHCLALPERRLAVIVKVHSGDESALATATRTALDTLAPGAFQPQPDWDWETVRNVAGVPVGDRIAELDERP